MQIRLGFAALPKRNFLRKSKSTKLDCCKIFQQWWQHLNLAPFGVLWLKSPVLAPQHATPELRGVINILRSQLRSNGDFHTCEIVVERRTGLYWLILACILARGWLSTEVNNWLTCLYIAKNIQLVEFPDQLSCTAGRRQLHCSSQSGAKFVCAALNWVSSQAFCVRYTYRSLQIQRGVLVVKPKGMDRRLRGYQALGLLISEQISFHRDYWWW